MNTKQREAQQARISDAMRSLVGNPEFQHFIGVLREQREIAIEDACSDTVVANERASMAAIGEVRAYKSIIAIYDEYMIRALDENDGS